uniref:Peptidase S1 domain-containing protein n=1 Tax=Panagrolaimus davidi TaxID=227884 RepID=A0A914R3E5_9BILA
MDPPVIFCAQHCVQENNIAKYQVRLGHYVWEAGLCGEIQRIAKMPGYVKGEKNDFAIVVLHHISEKYHFMIEAIELATEAPALETEHELLGYGKTRPEAENTRLAYGLTKLKNVFEELLYFEDKEIGGTQRDSGGPIVDIHGKLVGVIVQGQKNPKKPPVRTIGININDVNVRKFIKDNVPPKNV